MKLKFMRDVDYWVGVPVCFMLSCHRAIDKFFNPKKTTGNWPLKKVLFIKLSEMGTTTLAYPLLEKIREQNPGVQLCYLVFKKNAGALRLLGGLIEDKNIYGIEDSTFWRMAVGTLNALKDIRKAGFDVVIDLEFFSRCTAILSYLTGAPKRAGFYRYYLEGLYRGELLTHKIEYNSSLHCSHAYLSLAQALDQGAKDTPEFKTLINDEDLKVPHFQSTVQGQQHVREKLQKFGIGPGQRLFLVNPGEGTLPLREWPLENFLELCQRLLRDPKNMIAIVGCGSESKKNEKLCAQINDPRCVNLVDQTTINELLEVFQVATALIANDCGLVHLASLTPIQKFVFFGPGDPQVWGPLGGHTQIFHSRLACSPCLTVLNHRNSICPDNQCLKIIPVDHVYNRILEWVNQSSMANVSQSNLFAYDKINL